MDYFKAQDTAQIIQSIQKGERKVLGKAITLIESTLAADQELASKIIDACLGIQTNSLRIGITGIPGVGKSTFINALGKHLLGLKKRVAILAVDPSSYQSQGSILGDKTRMEDIASSDDIFIRPSPSSGKLGGVAPRTIETIFLCEAAGYDVILIETVGVGQSEFNVRNMVDCFLWLTIAGTGDQLQGIKRGIMEMVDAVIVNKADGNNIEASERLKKELEQALHLIHPERDAVFSNTCSSINESGILEIWNSTLEFVSKKEASNNFERNRADQLKFWFHEKIREQLLLEFYNNHEIKVHLDKLESAISKKTKSPFKAAEELLSLYRER